MKNKFVFYPAIIICIITFNDTSLAQNKIIDSSMHVEGQLEIIYHHCEYKLTVSKRKGIDTQYHYVVNLPDSILPDFYKKDIKVLIEAFSDTNELSSTTARAL